MVGRARAKEVLGWMTPWKVGHHKYYMDLISIFNFFSLGTQCPRKGCWAALGLADSGQPYSGSHWSGEQAFRAWWQVTLFLIKLLWTSSSEIHVIWSRCMTSHLFFRSKGTKKYTAIDKWNTQLKSLYQTISNRVSWDGRVIYELATACLHEEFHLPAAPNDFAAQKFAQYQKRTYKVNPRIFVWCFVILLRHLQIRANSGFHCCGNVGS